MLVRRGNRAAADARRWQRLPVPGLPAEGGGAGGRKGAVLERFQAKWRPARVKKTRQTKNLETRFDSIEAEKALVFAVVARSERDQAIDRASMHSGRVNGKACASRGAHSLRSTARPASLDLEQDAAAHFDAS